MEKERKRIEGENISAAASGLTRGDITVSMKKPRSASEKNISKYGLGLGTFIGKTLLEKNYASISFLNSEENKGAEVKIKWKNKDLAKI